MSRRPIYTRVPGADYRLKVLGHQRMPLRDFYHALLRMNWTGVFAIITALYGLVNVLFALGFLELGGVAHAAPGSFRDAFFFSVQTLATIGYGAMYPESLAANVLVSVESIVGILLTALATGLFFARISRSQARIVFTREAVITPMNGRPTLMFRLGNERGNQIVNAEFRVMISRNERTREGSTIYRSYDLRLVRDRALSLSRSWSVLHVIDADSPLYGQTPESIRAQELEIHIMVLGIDDTTMQSVHTVHRYFVPRILWGARHVDILSEDSSGDMVVDLNRFHDTQPTEPTTDFPYPKAG